jgi:hypothetical protein
MLNISNQRAFGLIREVTGSELLFIFESIKLVAASNMMAVGAILVVRNAGPSDADTQSLRSELRRIASSY